MNFSPEIVRGSGFDAEVIRTNRRKTATIKVREGKVSVVVPRSTSEENIEALLAMKSRWIREKLRIHRDYTPPEPKEYVSGASFAYLGRDYRLRVESGAVRKVALKSGRLIVGIPRTIRKREQYIQKAIVEWYRDRATEKLRDKVWWYSQIVGVTPASVSIKTYKGRWGSCSSNGHIRFNWKIIMAPNRIVDYVVVHELCHIHHHNHSPEYWECVERVFPDFRECKEWLRANGRILIV